MEKLANQAQEGIFVDTLLKEAYEILNNSKNLNGEREKLTRIFNQIAEWKDDNSEDANYYEAYQEIIFSMAKFDFSKRLPINAQVKSVENFFSVTINSLNDEFENKVLSKKMLVQLLNGLPLQNVVFIGTNTDGKINFFHTNKKSLFPNADAFMQQNIEVFFTDMQEINNQLQLQGFEKDIPVQLRVGYKGIAKLKIATASWMRKSEGLFYIITLPEIK